MYKKLPADILMYARSLRGTQTDAENLVWMLLRDRRLAGFKFRRQHPIGHYIVDFYCHEAQLAIELDGGGHNLDETVKYDHLRSTELASAGIQVVRFWNNDVLKDCVVVMESIYRLLQESTDKAPSPLPLSQRERELKTL
jgi:very-short-patch-repair endonuclease